MLRGAILLAIATTANAGAMELTKSNFDDAVKKSGKNAFVKFLAPWYRLAPSPLRSQTSGGASSLRLSAFGVAIAAGEATASR